MTWPQVGAAYLTWRLLLPLFLGVNYFFLWTRFEFLSFFHPDTKLFSFLGNASQLWLTLFFLKQGLSVFTTIFPKEFCNVQLFNCSCSIGPGQGQAMCDSFIRQALLLQSLSHRSATGKWMIYLTNQVRSDFKSDIQYFGCCKRAKYVTSADLTRSDEEVQFS